MTDETRRTHGYVHPKGYLKPSSSDLSDFWNFHQKFSKIKQKQTPPSYPIAKNELGVPSTFHTQHTIPFVCISHKDEGDQRKAEDFHEILRHYVQFKTKQSFTKVTKQIEYQKELPIFRFKNQIVAAVNSHPITIIAGKIFKLSINCKTIKHRILLD